MLRKLLRRFGVGGTVGIMTLASIALSELITLSISLAQDGHTSWYAAMIAFLVPAIIAPLFSSMQLRMVAQLEQAHNKLQHLSITDELTQTYNRRYFAEVADREFERSRQARNQVAVLLMDADNFKKVNDTYGHHVGDQVLRQMANITRSCIRKNDVLARWGGEEFIVLLPQASLAEALEVAERIRISVLSNPVELPEKPLAVSVSIGLATLESTMQRFDDMLRAADKALYRAKHQGKNRVEQGLVPAQV